MDLFKNVPLLTYEAASRAGDAIIAHARANGWSIAAVIVDYSTFPVWGARMTGAILASWPGAHMKAVSALRFARPTSVMQASGMQHYLAFDDTLPMTGGVPIVVGDDVIGGIGIGGGPGGPEGIECAQAGLAALGLQMK